MRKDNRTLVSPGWHTLSCSHFVCTERKVSLLFGAVNLPDAKEVMRTFTQGSPALGRFKREVMLLEDGATLDVPECERFKGVHFRGLVLPSKRDSQYVDLVKAEALKTSDSVSTCENSVTRLRDPGSVGEDR